MIHNGEFNSIKIPFSELSFREKLKELCYLLKSGDTNKLCEELLTDDAAIVSMFDHFIERKDS